MVRYIEHLPILDISPKGGTSGESNGIVGESQTSGRLGGSLAVSMVKQSGCADEQLSAKEKRGS